MPSPATLIAGARHRGMTMAASGVRATARGVLVDVVVTPGAPASGVVGVDPWRRAVRVRVAARAREGEANRALVVFLAETLAVPVTSVRVVAGAASRRKTVAIEGLGMEAVADRLRAAVI